MGKIKLKKIEYTKILFAYLLNEDETVRNKKVYYLYRRIYRRFNFNEIIEIFEYY